MRNLIRFVLLIPLLLSGVFGLCTESVQAKVIYFGSEAEPITLVYGGVTLFRFPTEVRTISQAARFEIVPANGDTPNYALLAVRPRFTTGTSPVVFILADGTTVRTRLRVVGTSLGSKSDAFYEFKAKESLLVEEDETKPGSKISELELMKALLRDDEVVGYEIRRVAHSIPTGFKHLEATVRRIYTGSQFNGYIIELSNQLRGQRLALSVNTLSLGEPNLAILSAVDASILEPLGLDGSRTFLRIVAKPAGLSRQLLLPVQMIDANKKGGGQ